MTNIVQSHISTFAERSSIQRKMVLNTPFSETNLKAASFFSLIYCESPIKKSGTNLDEYVEICFGGCVFQWVLSCDFALAIAFLTAAVFLP